jgi:hypothetical protein
MVGRAIRLGVRNTFRNPGLVVMTWLWNLALGSLFALPAFALLSSALARSRETELALDAFNIRLLLEVFQYNRSSVGTLFIAGIAGTMVLSLVAGTLLAGGVVSVLVTDEPGPLLARFFAGAGRLFGRYVRLTAINLVVAGVALALVLLASAPLIARLADSAWEPGGLVAQGLGLAEFLALAGLYTLVLDYAQIRLAMTDERSALRAWAGGVAYVARHPVATIGIGLIAAVAAAVVLGASVAIQATMGSATWGTIGLLILVQQATAIARTALRVAQIGCEASLARSLGVLLPPAPAVPAESPIQVPEPQGTQAPGGDEQEPAPTADS